MNTSKYLSLVLCFAAFLATGCARHPGGAPTNQSISVAGFGVQSRVQVAANQKLPLYQFLKQFQPIPSEVNCIAVKRGNDAPYVVPITQATNAAPPGGTDFLVQAGDLVVFSQATSAP